MPITITCNDLLQLLAPVLGTYAHLLKEGTHPRRFHCIESGCQHLSLLFAAKKPDHSSGWWSGETSQEGEHRFSLVRCSKGGEGRKSPSLYWPPEEVVFAGSTGESGFREGQELKGKSSNLTEDTVRFSGLQGTH